MEKVLTIIALAVLYLWAATLSVVWFVDIMVSTS